MVRRLSAHMTTTRAGREAAAASRDNWMIAVEATVIENADPEGMHRVKVRIDLLDEAVTHDEWVTALVPWVGAAGYGPAHAPEVGSEVLLFGRLGERHTLFYLSRFNEDFPVPAEFADGSRGCKCDTVLRLLGDALVQVISGTQLYLGGGDAADVDAPDVRLRAGQGNKVGFLGAAPVARQTLPPPATNLATCITLANALRAALITSGLCE
jgi:hypothetical protein